MAEQNATNPASSAIGEVQSVTGRVVAIGTNGVERQLFAGDLVYPDDLIKTSGQGSIVVALKDGTRFDLGRDAEALLDEAVYSDDVAAIKAAALADVAELQRAIVEGADPTEVAEAPAAGGEQGSAGESVQSAVGLDRTGRVGVVEAGFETRGVEQAIDPIVIDPIDFGLSAEPGSVSGGAPPVALVLTVSAPDNSGDNTPTITGTTDAAAGSIVTLVVIDSVGDTQNLAATVQTDGTYSVEVATALPEGDYTVDASVSDADGNSANASDPGSVNAVNDAPTAIDDVYSTNEGSALTVSLPNGVLANDNDLDGDSLTVNTTPVTDVVSGTLTLNGDGTFTYVPDPGWSGMDQFTYEVSDGNGGSAQATVFIDVAGANGEPVAVDDSGTTDEDVSLNIDVLANDTDLDLDTLSVSSVTQGANGTVVDNGDGTVTYTPNPDFNGNDSFTYTITDGNGGTDTATVNVMVDPANDVPVAVDDAYSTNEDTTLTVTLPNDVLLNDNDLDGDSLTVNTIPVADVANGTLTLNGDGTFTYVPNSGWTGIDKFTYEVSDGNGGTAEATVLIDVGGVNGEPVAVDDTGVVEEDATLTVSAVDGVIDTNDSDVDGDSLSVTSVRTGSESGSGAAGTVGSALAGTYGTLTLNNDGSYTYVADQAAADALDDGESATDRFAYTVETDGTETVTNTATITINGSNDAPTVDAVVSTTNEDAAGYTLDLLAESNASDEDGEAVSYVANSASVTSTTDAGGISISAAGVASVDPSHYSYLDDGESVVVTYDFDVTDGTETVTNTATITINGSNDAPTVDAVVSTTNEDAAGYTLDLLAESNASDEDGEAVSYVANSASVTSTTDAGGISISAAGVASVDPSHYSYLDDGESVVVTYDFDVTDGTETVTNTATITINGSNDAPTVDAVVSTTNEDAAGYTLDLLAESNASDEDGEAVSYVANSASVTSTTDAGGISISAAGVASVDPSHYSYLDDGESVVVTYDFDVTDGTETVTNTATITINGSNDAPTVDAVVSTTNEDAAGYTLDLLAESNASDEDGEAVSYVANSASVTSTTDAGGISISAAGVASVDPSHYSYLDDGESVVVTYDFDVTDGTETVTNTATITINGSNDAPTVDAVVSTTNEDAAGYTLDLLAESNASDEDGEAVSYVANSASVTSTTDAGGISISAAGVASVDPSHYSYLDDGESVVVTYDFDVTDGTETVTNTATITINGSNDAPTVDAVVSTTNEDAAGYTLDLLAESNASDEDGEAVSYVANSASVTSTTDAGGISISAAGVASVDPSHYSYLDDGESVVVTYDFDVTDGTETVTNTATITINGSNDAPTVDAVVSTTNEDAAGYTLDLLAESNASDEDGEAVSYVANSASVTSTTDAGGISISAAGVASVDPSHYSYLDDGESVVVTYDFDVTDGTETVTNTATITINGSNDAPTVDAVVSTTNEDAAGYTLDLLAESNASDEDGEAVSYVANSASVTSTTDAGGISISAAGVASVDPSHYSYLDDGESVVVTYDFDVTDGTETVTNTATITINGSNDAPTVDAVVSTTNEDAAGYTLDLLAESNASDEDGEAVSYVANSASVTSTTDAGGISISAAGVASVDPSHYSYLDDGESVVVTYDFDVTDGTETVTNTATITINGSNDAPTVDAVVSTTNEDAAGYTLDLLAESNASDEDGEAVSYVANSASVTSTTDAGGISISAAGVASVDPSHYSYLDDGESVVVTYDFDVTDGTETVTNTATITINGSNDAPTVDAVVSTTNEDAAGYTLDLLAESNASDEDGEAVSYVANSASVTSTTDAGGISISAAGVASVDPSHYSYLDDGESVVVTYDFDVTDGTETVTNTATITINGSNDGPIATANTNTIAEDAVDVSGNLLTDNDGFGIDSDPDGDSLTVSDVTGGDAYGTLGFNPDGSYTYTLDNSNPAVQALGSSESLTETYSYTVSDGNSGTDTATLIVTINGTNDAPTLDLDVSSAGSGYQAIFTEGSLPVSIADIDLDVADIDGPQLSSASVTLTNAEAGDVLNVSGILGVGVSVDTSILGEITVTLTGPADQTVFESAIKAITFENTADSPVAGDRFIDVRINDGDGGTASALTTISVTPVPTLSVTDVSVSEPEATLSGTAVVTGSIEDAGSDTAVDHWTFVHTGGALTIDATETSGPLDTHILLFELNPDGTIGALVADDKDDGPGNDARISGNFAAGDYAVVIGDETLSEAEARDPGAFPNGANDGGDYQITLIGAAYVDGTGDTVGFPPNGGAVVDSGLSNATVDLTYTVSLDEAPTVATGDVTVSYEIVDGTANVGTDYSVGIANPGTLTFAPGETSKTITVTVNADSVIESNETVLLNLTGLSANANYDAGAHVIPGGIQGVGTILSADNPPEIINNILTIAEGQTVVLTSSDLSATDADSNNPDLLFMMTNIEHGEFQLVSTGATITSFTQQQIIDGEIQFVHDGGELAPGYDVTVSDGLLIDTGSPTINFDANANDAPVADDDIYNVFEDIVVGTHLGTVVASDPDLPAQPLTYTITGGDPLGLFAIDAYGNITLAGGLDFDVQAVHTLTVEVSDGTLTDTATIKINVADQNAPIALDSAVTTAEDTQYVFTSGEFGFVDQDGDAMASVTITGLESVGSLRLWNGIDYDNVVVGQVISKAQLDNGDLVFDAAPDDNGLPYDSFAFSVNDDSGNAGTTSATMTVNVTPVNDSPVSPVTDSDASINLVGEAALVGTAVGLTGLANDLDPEDTVSYQLINNPNGYFSIDPATGQVTVASPLSVGAYDVLIRATSTDGTSSEEAFTIQVVDAADDFATVHESALQGGTGRPESAFDDNNEAGQDVAAGNGTTIATGNLLSNDLGATAITEINGVTPVGGVITVSSVHGQLVVDAATGDYTFNLIAPVDNSLGGDGRSALEAFSYTTDIGSATLNITIVDDVVQSNDVVTNVAEAAVEPYQLVFTLDVSGSMTGAQWGGVVYLEDGTTTTRLELAKDALKALATEYFSQSDSVELYLSTFATSAALLNGGAPYTDLQSALAAIDGINGSGGTNYEAGLGTIIDALDSDGDGFLDNTVSKAITYFISDGVPTEGNTTDPVGASGWDTFLSNNAVDSYGVGIGAGITDFSHLDAVNNVDADGSGTADGALNVSDVDSLESVLLGTVPASYGGSVVVNEGVSHVDFGADGGFIQSITVDLDTDADSLPDSAVTFVYDPATGQISNDGGFAAVGGDILNLDGTNYGFTYGTLIFNFGDGSYSYFVGTGVGEGDSFSLDFVAADGDGDVAESSRLQMNIVDGKPVANNDVDTLFSNGTSLEGNVITAVGTDGGVALGSAVASFALQGSGVDVAIDDAQVSAVDYRGNAIDLTVDSSGAGTGSDGTSFSYAVSGGVLTLTNVTDGSQLVFNTSGFYSYVPADLPVSPTGPAISEVFTDGGTGQGVILSTNDGTVTYQATYGAGIDDGVEDSTDARDVDYGETLTIEFDPATYIYGVANVSLELYGLTGTYESFDITVYGVDGSLIGQYSVGDVNTIHTENLPVEFSNIGRIEIQGGSATEASIRQVSFAPVLLDTTSAGLEPEVIGYTLTDTDGQSDSATLTLSTIHNTLVGGAADDTVTGTVANDLISGLDGDDILFGGDGRDILEGGLGDDSLYGQGGSDRLVGDEGDDLLVGADGNDVLLGGAGADSLQGDAGADELEGGAGNDTLLGGADNDTLRGNEGDDALDGGTGDDALYGGTGNDILVGGDGNDLLFGNVGDDVISGGSGQDTFVWKLNEQGNPAEPSVDVLTDFSIGDGDALDLSDLLVDEQSNALTDYLHFEYDAQNNQTVLQIDQDGGAFFRPTQEIVLQGVDLTAAGSLTDQQIIDTLISGNHLITD